MGNISSKNWTGTKFSKGKRFTKQNPFYKQTISPGPSYNLQDKHSLTKSDSNGSLNGGNSKKDLFGNTYNKYKNVYFPELAKDFQNREGPGPGYYEERIRSIREKTYSFPKDDRKMSKGRKADNSPGPTSYAIEKKMKKFQNNIGTIFGRSARDFDMIIMNQ